MEIRGDKMAKNDKKNQKWQLGSPISASGTILKIIQI